MKTYKINNVEVSKEELQKVIKENPELLERKVEVKGRYFFPKEGEKFFYVDDAGWLGNKIYSILGIEGHRNTSTGVFKTAEDAYLALKKQQAIVSCWKWAQENAPFEPDWSDGEEKYYVRYSYRENELEITHNYWLHAQFTLPYFKSEEDCESFIEANKADLELLFLK